MNFREVMRGLAAAAPLAAAQAAIRSEYGRHASRWLADEAGISPRTARRWLSGAVPKSRADTIRAAADPNRTAAIALRGASAITVGQIAVAYDDRDEGVRAIGDLHVDEQMRQELDTAADALDNGDWRTAEDAFSNAVISGEYGNPNLGVGIISDDELICRVCRGPGPNRSY